MWVGADPDAHGALAAHRATGAVADLDNAGALATYRATGAVGAGGCAVLVWDFEQRSN